MPLLKSRLQFWLLLIIALNVLGLILMTLRGVWVLPAAPSVLQLLQGFFLQFPVLVGAALLDFAIIGLVSRLPLSVFLKLPLRFSLLYLFLFFYLSSTAIYLGVGVFISFEVIEISVLDYAHILPIIVTTALPPLLLVAVLALLLLLPLHRWPRCSLPALKKRILPVFLMGFVCFVTASILAVLQISRYPQASVAVLKNTFPATFLLGQVFEAGGRTSVPVGALNIDMLEPQISMAEYREQAGELKTRPPVFLIMLESISYDHLGFTGYHRKDITPNLDALFAQSVFFDRTYSPSNHSNLAQGSILSAQYALRGIRIQTFEHVNFVKPMLFDVLHEYGYETAVYSAQDENWLGMRRFLEANGAKIDHFKHALDFPQYFKFFDGKIDDAELIDEAEVYLTQRRNAEKPIMLYVNLQRTHYDYRLKPEVKGHYGELGGQVTGMFFDYGEHQAEKAKLQFDNSLHYVDQQLGRFFNLLKAQGLYDDALIIVTADHGEAFYENGYATHGTSMYDAQIRSFLSIKRPGQALGEYRSDMISSVDMLPMALQALGLPNHPAFQGYQLLQEKRSDYQPVFSIGQSVIRAEAIVQYPWKYSVSEKEGAVLVNLDKDPKERNNQLKAEPDVAARMQGQLMQYRQNQLDYYQKSDQSVRDQYYAPRYDFTPSEP